MIHLIRLRKAVHDLTLVRLMQRELIFAIACHLPSNQLGYL